MSSCEVEIEPFGCWRFALSVGTLVSAAWQLGLLALTAGATLGLAVALLGDKYVLVQEVLGVGGRQRETVLC